MRSRPRRPVNAPAAPTGTTNRADATAKQIRKNIRSNRDNRGDGSPGAEKSSVNSQNEHNDNSGPILPCALRPGFSSTGNFQKTPRQPRPTSQQTQWPTASCSQGQKPGAKHSAQDNDRVAAAATATTYGGLKRWRRCQRRRVAQPS